MENFKANICIFFEDSSNNNNHTSLKRNIHTFNDDTLKKLLYSIYIALKGDVHSTPDFDTTVNVSIINNYILLSISDNNISKFRATILSLLTLTDLAHSILRIDA